MLSVSEDVIPPLVFSEVFLWRLVCGYFAVQGCHYFFYRESESSLRSKDVFVIQKNILI